MDDRWRQRFTMLRSALAGGAATLVDMALLALLVGAFGVPARIANAPALLAGASVQFFGNRHFAFRAGSAPVARQLLWFTVTEVVALALNAIGFDLAMRALAPREHEAVVALVVRAGVSFVVFSAWSYPIWRRVFTVPITPSAEGAALGASPSRRGA
jgi:putative flippase GtrA